MDTEPVDLLDVLLNPDNNEPIVLMDENGRLLTFDQLAVIPLENGGDKQLYCVLKPLDKLPGIADDGVIVFRINTKANGPSTASVETDEATARLVFQKFQELAAEEE